ncbi:MAG: alanine--tRNA ligase [Clostridia bacterium]|nr:alanine--tRNA ligase [Clostridia bacterium]
MKWTSLNDLREKFLSFFEEKGHLRLPSFSLVPHNDKSLLLINSGMAPMKKFFTGEEKAPRNRVCTCQKCIRTPDLERVGHTARHGTFFEMLGNFSFGDYFKNEAIPWAWEFLTECLEIPSDLLWPSIYEEDDESYDIWVKKVGVNPAHIVRLGKADNFWEHGTRPCGPCSEIYFDRGIKYGCGKPDCKPGCDCDRYMEIWNNVFCQFNNMGDGTYTELASKNIDTGMGLERLACVMQGVDNMFEVDSIRKILDSVCAVAGKKYGENAENDISIRVITDHIRASLFMIADGVIPSNEGRGYVLRRILRRACRHGKLLGIEGAFLTGLCLVAMEESCGAYPALSEKKDYILKVMSMEEERFAATIDQGLSILNGMTDEAKKKGEGSLTASDVFKLYDTYGFPFDLTKEIAEEKGLSVDEEGFRVLMEEQRVRARNARANISGWSGTDKSVLSSLPQTTFLGYDKEACEGKVLAILTDEGEADAIGEGEASVVTDQTVFYGEGGGQVGDTGEAENEHCKLLVLDTKKTEGIYIHQVKVQSGELKKGDTLVLSIDKERRDAIRRNHSACHLLQAALRQTLGTHVEQAGSYVDETRVRFDFSHFSAMTASELAAVEAFVNAAILKAEATLTEVCGIEEAKKKGAMALFGEKYGDSVRLVRIGEKSLELCGGTHVKNTGNIGLFRIISESSVAAGVRRIEGTTGLGVLSLLAEREALLQETAKELKAPSVSDLPKRAGGVLGELKEAHRALESAEAKLADAKLSSLLSSAKTLGKVRLLTAKLNAKADEGRALCDSIKGKHPDMVAVLALIDGEKLNFVACCGADAVKAGAHAGNLLKVLSAMVGGKGGGRPDSAMSGGKDIDKVDEALKEAENILSSL